MASDAPFLGTGWRFPPSFDHGGRRAAMTSGEDDIRESLAILFATAQGERVMQPTYGCELRAMVFTVIDASAVTAIQDAVRRAVLFCEPRIDLESVEVDESRAAEGILHLDLVYTVRGTNTRSNMVYPFYFLEGTSLVR
ncbi:GPW/gp25 family protein [Oryzomicrobium sp.]|uniref:GPW/gp25 family protein n=1 Tax=Oryzomicrobium sp. TaxID=1911578 RepID=UPI0025F5768C|nr:GPW/gp25 family protein [Oryzomicrobium sp.]MCE1244202.1 GPW/gp25 family protein [Oryzomicrobium sp.]